LIERLSKDDHFWISSLLQEIKVIQLRFVTFKCSCNLAKIDVKDK